MTVEAYDVQTEDGQAGDAHEVQDAQGLSLECIRVRRPRQSVRRLPGASPLRAERMSPGIWSDLGGSLVWLLFLLEQRFLVGLEWNGWLEVSWINWMEEMISVGI